MCSAVFLDEALTTPLYTAKAFEELDNQEYHQLQKAYLKSLSRFNSGGIQKLAASSFMQDLFRLCGDRIIDLFGKPIIQFTK